MANDMEDAMEDMKMAMALMPVMASAIRRMRLQKQAEAQKNEVLTQPPPQDPKYRQNKWEVSPSG